MTDQLRLLPPFKWRGIQYPVLERRVSFGHEGASSRIQYRDNDFIEQLGAHSLTFSFKVAMRQGIVIKSDIYRNLFTEGLPNLFRDMRDRTRAILEDPVYGPFPCVPVRFDEMLDVNRRDGADVDVEFVHSPDIAAALAESPNPTLQAVATDGKTLDAEVSRVDWQQEASPEPTMDPINAITGVGAQVQAQGNKTVAAMHDFAFRCEKLEEQAKRLENPDGFHVQQAARRNRAAALELAKRAKDPQRRIVTVTNRYQRTLTSVASEVGMTAVELIELNPGIQRLPFVPPNLAVRVYKTDG